ncbi:MAG: DegT/DnrJ/EryC1/StrS family aminotransferase [Candidatus Omnitrophica bacterium]|nr:DegT/DnrJ/EryC1/StrS family aminotransferase [Candidatus Omnitrophota bacterium]
MNVPFIDVKSQNAQLMSKSLAGLKKVMEAGDFILGAEVKHFESDFAAFCNGKFALGVNSGTDALFLSLLSLGIGAGDEVICPVYTYIATALSISYTGAKPVFVDIDAQTYNIDPDKIEKKITSKTKAIIAVHLYGQPANMLAIKRIAKAHKLKVIEDAAQAHGAAIKNNKNLWNKVGVIGDIGCFSFYPTKNLGGCGDGGLVLTDNKRIYEKLHMLRDQGRKGKNRYLHFVIGYNSRLDSLQAVILREKLKMLETWNDARRKTAHLYSQLLKDCSQITIPLEMENYKHVFHLYPILLKGRDGAQKKLGIKNIGTGIVYHKPLHLQVAYKELGYKKGDFPIAESVSEKVLCLPMHSNLSSKQVEYVVDSLKQAT